MAMPESVMERWNALTEDEQAQAASFIDFLLLKRSSQMPGKTHFQFDALKGGLVYIADDFDETPEDFEEYM